MQDVCAMRLTGNISKSRGYMKQVYLNKICSFEAYLLIARHYQVILVKMGFGTVDCLVFAVPTASCRSMANNK